MAIDHAFCRAKGTPIDAMRTQMDVIRKWRIMGKPTFIIFIFFILISQLFGNDKFDLALNEFNSYRNEISRNFLNSEDRFLLGRQYVHEDYVSVPGDSFYCDIVGDKINIEDIYIIEDDINLINPKKEKLIVITFSYYWYVDFTPKPGQLVKPLPVVHNRQGFHTL